MNLILVRHGKTKESEKGVLLGSLPGNLSQEGKEQMKLVAQEIKNKGMVPDIIISSDLKRTKDSATILSKELGVKVIYNPLLRERKGGITEGKTENEINWDTYEQTPLLHRKHKGGESFVEVRERAKKFLDYLRSKKHNTVLIVSHSMFLAMLISLNKRIGIKKSLSTKFNASIQLSIKQRRTRQI